MASSKTMQAKDHMSAGVEYLAPSSTCSQHIFLLKALQQSGAANSSITQAVFVPHP